MVLFRMHDFFNVFFCKFLWNDKRKEGNFRKTGESDSIFSIMPVCSHDPHSTLALYSIYITLYKSEETIRMRYKQLKRHNMKTIDGMC